MFEQHEELYKLPTSLRQLAHAIYTESFYDVKIENFITNKFDTLNIILKILVFSDET